MNLNKLIIERKVGIVEEGLLNPVQAEIHHLLRGLDLVAHRAETRWGCGRLEKLAPPAVAEKWTRQLERLNEAITASDMELVRELVAGTIRGWHKLEELSLAAGHCTYAPPYWDLNHGGKRYRVVLDYTDAFVFKDAPEVIISLPELIGVFHARHEAVFNQKPVVVEKREPTQINWKDGGDALGL